MSNPCGEGGTPRFLSIPEDAYKRHVLPHTDIIQAVGTSRALFPQGLPLDSDDVQLCHHLVYNTLRMLHENASYRDLFQKHDQEIRPFIERVSQILDPSEEGKTALSKIFQSAL